MTGGRDPALEEVAVKGMVRGGDPALKGTTGGGDPALKGVVRGRDLALKGVAGGINILLASSTIFRREGSWYSGYE